MIKDQGKPLMVFVMKNVRPSIRPFSNTFIIEVYRSCISKDEQNMLYTGTLNIYLVIFTVNLLCQPPCCVNGPFRD